MSSVKQVAVAAAKAAGKKLEREYKTFKRSSVKLKSHNEIVTRADLISNETIIKAIRKNFPAHQILSEESGKSRSESDYLWVVDPLDGTTNFSIHNPLWSVSIALSYENEVILGVIYSVLADEMFVAERGKGAYLNAKKIQTSKKVSEKTIHAFCHGHREHDIKKALKYYNYQKLHNLDCRQLGSAAIELAYVASGRIESIMIPGAHPWDVAAGVLMVEEAGGLVTDFKGKEWNLDSSDMVASNGKNHKEILKIINR